MRRSRPASARKPKRPLERAELLEFIDAATTLAFLARRVRATPADQMAAALIATVAAITPAMTHAALERDPSLSLGTKEHA